LKEANFQKYPAKETAKQPRRSTPPETELSNDASAPSRDDLARALGAGSQALDEE
jgi:hypothetical protein